MRQYSDACRVLTRPEHFARIATEFVEDAAAVGVRYAEVTFTPEGTDAVSATGNGPPASSPTHSQRLAGRTAWR
jgi:adenosine deaminase